MNVKRLDGRQLNFWVAKSARLVLSTDDRAAGGRHDPQSGFWHPHTFNPANDWSHAGTLISEEWFAIEDMLIEWFGPNWSHIPAIAERPLTWFLRAYVATQFGDEVEDLWPTPVQPWALPACGEPGLAQAAMAGGRPRSWLKTLLG